MDLMGYLQVLRRRWALPLASAAVALVLVWLTLPPAEERSTPVGTTFRATATLIAASPDEQLNLSMAALLVRVGEVPVRAARQLDFEGSPQLLATQVEAVPDTATASLAISSAGPDGPVVEDVANTFAEELVAHFGRARARATKAELARVEESITSAATEIHQLDRAVLENPEDSTLQAERAGLEAHFEQLVTQAATLRGTASSSPFEILQSAVAVPQSGTTFTPPSSPGLRLAIGGALGLALGLALAVVIDQMDSRLRTRDETEAALGVPVLAQIPTSLAHRSATGVLSASDPRGRTAEAYRGLRAAVLLGLTDLRGDLESTSSTRPAPVLLVTSARPGDGKTTTVANLAVMLAESGRSVLVLSLDFRHPRVHEYLDAPDGAGVSDLLRAGTSEALSDVVRTTAHPGVLLATSGRETGDAGALVAAAGPLLREARGLADVVLVDTAPLLSVSDAVDLSPHVDAVLVVARSKRTTVGQARAVRRLLDRLPVVALGAVLLGGSDEGVGYGYATPNRWRTPSDDRQPGPQAVPAGATSETTRKESPDA